MDSVDSFNFIKATYLNTGPLSGADACWGVIMDVLLTEPSDMSGNETEDLVELAVVLLVVNSLKQQDVPYREIYRRLQEVSYVISMELVLETQKIVVNVDWEDGTPPVEITARVKPSERVD